MSLKNLFSVLMVFTILGLFSSCNVEEEETTEIFNYNYVLASNVGDETVNGINHSVYEYTSTRNENGYKIIGVSASDDSIVFDLGLVPGKELLVGLFDITPENKILSITHYKKMGVAKMIKGTIDITYVNRRIDLTFEGLFANGDKIEKGVLDNILIESDGLKKLNGSVVDNGGNTGGTTDPTPTPDTKSILADFDNENYIWTEDFCASQIVVNTVIFVGNNNERLISITVPNLDLSDLTKNVNKTFTANDGASVSYTQDLTDPNKHYLSSTNCSVTITSANSTNNTLDFKFSTEVMSPATGKKINITNGKGIAINL